MTEHDRIFGFQHSLAEWWLQWRVVYQQLVDSFALVEKCYVVLQVSHHRQFEAYDVVDVDGNITVNSNNQIVPSKYNMNAIPSVLPSSDEFDKLSEVQQYLERCLHSSGTAGVIEFYVELAKLEGETLKVALDKAFTASKSIKDIIETAQQAAPLIDKLAKWGMIKARQCDDWTKEEERVLYGKFRRASLRKVYEYTTKTCTVIAEIVSIYWNYLPVELQEFLESYALRVSLFMYEVDSEHLVEKFKYVHELTSAARELVVSVFKASEENKSRPKLRLLSFVGELNSFPAGSSSFLKDTNLASAKTAIYEETVPAWELVWGQASYEELINKSKEKIFLLNELDPKNDIEAQEQADILKYLHE